MKWNVGDVYENRLNEAILIHIHNIWFYGEILKIITFIILIPILDFSYFNNMRGANLGSLLYGDASVMYVDSSEYVLVMYLGIYQSCTLANIRLP